MRAKWTDQLLRTTISLLRISGDYKQLVEVTTLTDSQLNLPRGSKKQKDNEGN